MSFIVKKQNNKLFFENKGGYQTRNESTMWCIEQADKIYNWKDFNELHIFTGDYEKSDNQYTYSKINSFNKLIPDFNFHGWPQAGITDYDEQIKKIDEAGKNDYQINKVGWIGNVNTHPNRKIMFNIGNSNKELFEFNSMNWIKVNNQVKLNATKYISLDDLVKTYSILIDIEGNGYSGRLKYLLWSHRPLLLVDRPHKEYFFEFLEEWKHYIPVKRDLSDLVEKTQWCLTNYCKALQIAENAFEFSKKYLTRDACFEQWNKIIIKNI